MSPYLSIVVPVFNEEAILDSALLALTTRLSEHSWDYELIISENGSNDATKELAHKWAETYPRIRALTSEEPNYGKALRRGIEASLGSIVVCDEIDLGDISFYERALALLEQGADMVVGSKRHPQSRDRRPWIRRQGTAVINGLLRVSLGFTGTDTHGLKAFWRQQLLPVLAECRVEYDLFASELVIRAERAGLNVREIPLTLQEIRPPSIALARRVPRVLGNLAKLIYTIRLRD